jgi:hypothetical protein
MQETANDTLFGLLAQFETPERLLEAATRTREAGYRKIEAYLPYPVHGIDEALGRKRSGIPLLALAGGFAGAITAYSLEYYCSAIGYPINIGGRPLNSWPQFMPIVFELTVLGASFASFFGSMILNGLPMPYHPLFNVEAFKLASQNRFFLSIEADDPQFKLAETRQFLEGLPVEQVFEVPK